MILFLHFLLFLSSIFVKNLFIILLFMNIMKKVRVVSPVHDKSTGPPFHSYQILSNL